MPVRSLPHFAHSPIGKTTHKKGMSYSHVNYITRDEACSKTLAENMPADRDGARPFFEREANKEGVPANARIADTLIIALPIELSLVQRHEAIAGFMGKIGHGRIAWLAAFHDIGKDEKNPHCHIIFRDADIDTGRKVVGTTTSAKDVKEAQEHGWRVPPRMSTKDLRVAWCDHLNAEMERHGYEARFDHRTLKQQGIDRVAEIHVGPKAMSMAERGKSFDSQDRRRGDHANPYTLLDNGSRAEHNERIKEDNRRRDAYKQNGQNPTPQVSGPEGVEKRQLRDRQFAERKAMYQEQSADRAALRAAHETEKLEHHRWGRTLYADARERAFQEIRTDNAKRWDRVRAIKNPERREIAFEALKIRQKKDYADRAEKQIALARSVKNAAWQDIKQSQETARRDLQLRHVEETAALSRQHIAERHALHEKWRDQHLQTQAGKLSAKLESRQGMAAVQSTALTMIKQNAEAQRRNTYRGKDQAALNPLEASAHFAERGRAENAARGAFRLKLTVERRLNEMRSTATGAKRAKDRIRSKCGKGARRHVDQQVGVGQAVGSDRSSKHAEKASASPHVNASLSNQERSAKDDRRARLEAYISQRSGKGRNGGRSGR